MAQVETGVCAFSICLLRALLGGDGDCVAQPGAFGAVPDPAFFNAPACSCCWAPSSWRMILVVVYVGAVAVCSCLS